MAATATPSTAMPFSAPQLSPSRIPPPLVSQQSYKAGHRHLDVFSPVDQNGSFHFDRVLKSGKVNRRAKNKGAWKPSWKPAYLVLRPNLLSIYQDQDETELKASITLSEVTAVAPVRKAHTDNVFGVFSPSKNYHFQGTSAKDAAEWIANIRLETSSGGDDDLDLRAPVPTPYNAEASNTYESTDMSADELQAAAEQESLSTTSNSRARSGSQAATRQRRHSNLQDYSGNEQFTTSHSDVSDVVAGSLPKHSTTSLTKPPVLSPIASSQQLKPDPNPTPASKSPGLAPGPSSTVSRGNPAPAERVIRQGHLQILKSYKTGVKGWKTIWVVLRPKSLSFYKNSEEYSAVKIFSMDSVINAAEIDPISRTKANCFQVITDEKTYRLCARDDGDLEKWLGALTSVLAKREEKAKQVALQREKVALSQKEKAAATGSMTVEGMTNLSLR